MTDEQIKHMVDRFLCWQLPENFHPDAGISFAPDYNTDTPYPGRHEPCGTNLFDAEQAERMVRYMIEGMPDETLAKDDMVETATHRLWIAGDYDDAIRAAREFCHAEGACFAIHPVDYVYTGGMEAGVCATLINYPRFPATEPELREKMERFAALLCERLYQNSYTIEGPTETVWVSHRETG